MYVLFGKKREIVWALLAVLVVVTVLTGVLHGTDAVSGRTAALLIYGWSIISFSFIATIVLWFEPEYVPRLADIQFPELRRAMFIKASMAVVATLLTGLTPQDVTQLPVFVQFVVSASGVFVLADWLASVRMLIVSRRKDVS